MKLWIIPRHRGWDVHCLVGKNHMEHWFTSPSKKFVGSKVYLVKIGFYKVNTNKRFSKFKKLWEEAFKDINLID